MSARINESPDIDLSNATPMMRQYLEIKSKNQDAILFYRLGDFYEMFYEDAIEASKILDLTLTSRNKNQTNAIPLCGIPYHAAESYIAKLVENGKKVVVCEQTEDPKLAKGIVKREVTRIISPGMIMEDQGLSARANNFLLCFTHNKDGFAGAICDISTGHLEYFSYKKVEQLQDEILRLQIPEAIYPESLRESEVLKAIFLPQQRIFHHAVSDLYYDKDYASDLLTKYYRVSTLSSLDLQERLNEISVLGGLFGYLQDCKILQPDLLQQPKERKAENYLFLDETTLRNLELFKTLRDEDQRGSLFWHLDACATVMGSRKLAEVIRSPLLAIDGIHKRLDAVEELLGNAQLLNALTENLQRIADLERIANKFIVQSANARDANAIRDSLVQLPDLKQTLISCQSPLLKDLAEQIHLFEELREQINHTIVDEPPFSLREGGLIRLGVNPELDELRQIESQGKNYIAQLELKEKEASGISSLKIRYNNVFGYYIEITNTHKDKVPANYIRKQTLSNAERYITEELKNYESKVLGAGERIKVLEYEIFCQLRQQIQAQASLLKNTASAVAMTDVLYAFATTSQKFRYQKPQLTNEIVLELKGARHPILERMNPGENFVPNDLYLDQSQNSEIIITGPNMAGKSTLMRMVALTVLMGQIGCFVPCDEAKIGICDRIFTRVGAHDHLQKGLSTFMVEMVETAKILREATPKSLILLDEIGRGTSTFDGLSIAWAVAEDLHDRLHARTLFATHYHELCDLSQQKKGIKNYHMAVKEWNGEIIFLRKLQAGGTNRSYGVAVAAMAGLPLQTIKRAKEILKLLELKDLSFQSEVSQPDHSQMALFQPQESAIMKKLKELNVEQLTPLEALNFLAELKNRSA